jgi:hypothetical protein
MSVKAFLDTGMGSVAGDSAPFFANNQLVKVCMGLDNFNLAGEADKATLLRFVLRFVRFCWYLPYIQDAEGLCLSLST